MQTRCLCIALHCSFAIFLSLLVILWFFNPHKLQSMSFSKNRKYHQMMVNYYFLNTQIIHALHYLYIPIGNLFYCTSWHKMPQFLSLGIMLNLQSKHWYFLAQEEAQADVGELCASRIIGVWQWGVSTRWQQAMDQDIAWVELKQANKMLREVVILNVMLQDLSAPFNCYMKTLRKPCNDWEVRCLQRRRSAFFSCLSPASSSRFTSIFFRFMCDTTVIVYWTWRTAQCWTHPV